MLTNSTSRESWKIALVPLPWCTSQSSTSTARRRARRARGARRSPRSRTGRSPSPSRARRGGPAGAAPRSRRARRPSERLHERARAAGRPQRRLVGARAGGRVHVEGAPPRSLISRTRSTYSRGCTRSSCSSVAAGASRRSQPSQSRASSSASIGADPVRPLRVAEAGVVLERGRVAEERRHARRYGTGAPWTTIPSCTDVAVVGAGAAGLYAALVAAAEGASVALVSRSPLAQTASYWAQGGIAAALAEGDSPEQHAAGHARRGPRGARASAVRVLCEESPARVRDLQALGVQFDADRHGNLALGLEGGHSRRRIVTPAAPRPAAGSRASCPRSPPRTSASRCSSRSRPARSRQRRGPLHRPHAPPRGRRLPVLARAP